MKRISLKNKIFINYIALLFAINVIVITSFYFQKYIVSIGKDIPELREDRDKVHNIYHLITKLTTLGEVVIAWDSTDLNEYQKYQSEIDNYLIDIKNSDIKLTSTEQIDSLRGILQDKKVLLLYIMELFQKKEEFDSILINELPQIMNDLSKIKTITKKKKGLLGSILGKKEFIYIPPSVDRMNKLKDTINSEQKELLYEIETYIDSLKIQNKILNYKITSFLNSWNAQVQKEFCIRDEAITKSYDNFSILFSIVVIIIILLQLFSFLFIKSELKKEESSKLKLKKVIQENNHLLQMSKNLILTVSHDIRGPLGNIINCAELASDTKDKRKRETYLEDIRYSCRHILHLVNDLLDVYRINEAKDTRNDVPFYLYKMIKRISDDYRKKSNKKALIFNSKYKNIDVVVKGDSDKIEQILNNVLTNAVKFTEFGHIDFISEYSDGKLLININDTGIGMDDETLNRVFRPFERAAQNVNSEGFGLGLFITKGLVDVLNGDMNVKSTHGKGTEFHLSFPLEETSEIVNTEDIQYKYNGILPKRIIVVDDDELQLKIAEDMLGRNGIICKTCLNAKEVVSTIQDSEYDLILTDIQMNGMDGFSLLKLLRESDIGNSRTIPIAAMTARNDGDSGIYVNSGFCGYIYKPFSMKNLLFFLSSITINETQKENYFDYTLLLKNIGDQVLMFELLIRESNKDLIELKKNLENIDRNAIRQIIHRMIPVWELLKKRDILDNLKSFIHNEEMNDNDLKNQIIPVIKSVELLIMESEKELKKYDKEKKRINTRG